MKTEKKEKKKGNKPTDVNHIRFMFITYNVIFCQGITQISTTAVHTQGLKMPDNNNAANISKWH